MGLGSNASAYKSRILLLRTDLILQGSRNLLTFNNQALLVVHTQSPSHVEQRSLCSKSVFSLAGPASELGSTHLKSEQVALAEWCNCLQSELKELRSLQGWTEHEYKLAKKGTHGIHWKNRFFSHMQVGPINCTLEGHMVEGSCFHLRSALCQAKVPRQGGDVAPEAQGICAAQQCHTSFPMNLKFPVLCGKAMQVE